MRILVGRLAGSGVENSGHLPSDVATLDNEGMEMPKKEKSFDAVKMMRQIRDKISEETKDMSFEELRAYINRRLSESKTPLVGQHPK